MSVFNGIPPQLTPHLGQGDTAGENNRRAKLNWAQVRHIRKCLANGVDYRELAALFGVNKSVISNIKANRVWWEPAATMN